MQIEIPPYLVEQRLKRIDELERCPLDLSFDVALPEVANFREAITQHGHEPNLIAEFLSRSNIIPELQNDNPMKSVARVFENSGVNAISVHVSSTFGGKFEDLLLTKRVSQLPLMCFDFIVDRQQIVFAKKNGASSVILFASMLEENELREHIELTHELGMDALVEVATPFEIERALSAGAKIIGINNRSLYDLKVDFTRTPTLVPYIPNEIPIVSESGFQTHEDVSRVVEDSEGRVSAILVGSSISGEKTLAEMRSKIFELRNLSSHEKQVVVVTGGTRGIGLGLVEWLSQNSHHVATVGRNTSLIDKINDELPDVFALQMDLLDFSSSSDSCVSITNDPSTYFPHPKFQAFIDETLKRFGRIDSVILNAFSSGLNPNDPIDSEAWIRSIVAQLYIVTPLLAKTNGRLIFITSSLSDSVESSLELSSEISTGIQDYIDTKIAIEQQLLLLKNWAQRTYGWNKITVIDPGSVDTQMQQDVITYGPKAFRERALLRKGELRPVKEVAQEIAYVALEQHA